MVRKRHGRDLKSGPAIQKEARSTVSTALVTPQQSRRLPRVPLDTQEGPQVQMAHDLSSHETLHPKPIPSWPSLCPQAARGSDQNLGVILDDRFFHLTPNPSTNPIGSSTDDLKPDHCHPYFTALLYTTNRPVWVIVTAPLLGPLLPPSSSNTNRGEPCRTIGQIAPSLRSTSGCFPPHSEKSQMLCTACDISHHLPVPSP